VHAKTSYDKTDIAWGARFLDMYLPDTMHVSIDLGPSSESERVTPPEYV